MYAIWRRNDKQLQHLKMVHNKITLCFVERYTPFDNWLWLGIAIISVVEKMYIIPAI